MKKATYITIWMIGLFLFLGNVIPIYSQPFTDELINKLPRIDQYKFLKAETFNKKGKAFLEKGGIKPDSATLSDTTLSEKEEEKIDNYYINRIKASYCFRDANGLLYYVLDKYIKAFWKKNKENKKSLDIFVKIENAAYDSLIRADKLREMAEKESAIADKIPLVSTAEAMEGKALFRLEKVLFVYVNWPEPANIPWLFSDDKINPRIPEMEKEVLLSSIQLDLDSTKKDTAHRATSIYNLMHISENQIDNFNEFLKTKYPDKTEAYLIDFQKLHSNVIDSLHRKWEEYSFGQKIDADNDKSSLFSTVRPPDKTVKSSQHVADRVNLKLTTETNTNEFDASGFVYKVQLSACRIKLQMNELSKVYPDLENIVESFEDNWFKYTAGSFKSYQQAKDFKVTLKVKGAFVIAYYNNKRIKITTDMIKP